MSAEDVDWTEARRMFESDGASYREIAGRWSCSHVTVINHAKDEGWTRADGALAARDAANEAKTAAAVHATKLKWEQRRGDEADAAGIVAARARGSVVEALEAKDYRGAKEAAVTYAILIDKAQLLTGGATSRPAMPDEIAGHVGRLGGMRDELTDRRAQAS